MARRDGPVVTDEQARAWLYDWQVPLARNELEAGGSLSFTSRLPNPNKKGRKLAVRFNP